MHWTEFQKQAQKVHSKFFFKRTMDGYEVWDVAQISGPGMPRRYKCMVIPFGTNSVGFQMMFKKLKRGNWNRRLALACKNTVDSMLHNEMIKINKQRRIEEIVTQAAKGMRKTFKKVSQELGINERSMRLAMKDVSWDDTKAVLRKQMEARGAYK